MVALQSNGRSRRHFRDVRSAKISKSFAVQDRPSLEHVLEGAVWANEASRGRKPTGVAFDCVWLCICVVAASMPRHPGTSVPGSPEVACGGVVVCV
ncbi:MAG: hypothetical protein ACK46M_01310, partial [Planctomyces sp.]